MDKFSPIKIADDANIGLLHAYTPVEIVQRLWVKHHGFDGVSPDFAVELLEIIRAERYQANIWFENCLASEFKINS